MDQNICYTLWRSSLRDCGWWSLCSLYGWKHITICCGIVMTLRECATPGPLLHSIAWTCRFVYCSPMEDLVSEGRILYSLLHSKKWLLYYHGTACHCSWGCWTSVRTSFSLPLIDIFCWDWRFIDDTYSIYWLALDSISLFMPYTQLSWCQGCLVVVGNSQQFWIRGSCFIGPLIKHLSRASSTHMVR